jgi:alpha/beta superfamily hydrolase
VTHFTLDNFKGLQYPWLLIQGEADEVVAPEAVFKWVETLIYPPQVIRFPAVGHFFHGQLVTLGEKVQFFLESNLHGEGG